MAVVTGLDASRVEALRERVQREVDAGLLPSCQIALARHGDVLLSEAFGDATADTRYAVFSCTKAFVVSTVWQLIGDGSLDVSARVGDLVPEFATNGKDVVTVEQVMLHTSGFPHAPLKHPEWSSRGARLEAFGRWRLNWEPGTRYEYHPTSAHWVLAEIVERLTDLDYRDVLEQRVTEPIGLPRMLGIAPEDQAGIATLRQCGEPTSPDELEAIFGVRELPVTEVTDEALLSFNRPAVRAVGVPGGGGVMRAADLARFYQHLLHDPLGLWDPALRADVTGTVRNHLPDPLLNVPANRTLGLVVAGDDGKAAFRGFGHGVSPATFGHNGAAGQIAFADPQTGLSFGYCTNGIDADVLRQARRSIGIASRAARCAAG